MALNGSEQEHSQKRNHKITNMPNGTGGNSSSHMSLDIRSQQESFITPALPEVSASRIPSQWNRVLEIGQNIRLVKWTNIQETMAARKAARCTPAIAFCELGEVVGLKVSTVSGTTKLGRSSLGRIILSAARDPAWRQYFQPGQCRLWCFASPGYTT